MIITPDTLPRLPAIRFTDLTQVRAILAAVRQTGVSAAAWTIPDAAAIAGPAWFHALFTQALSVPLANTSQPFSTPPTTSRKSGEFHMVLDCGAAAGHTVEALHRGVRCLHFSGPAETQTKLRSIAAQTGAWMVAAPMGPELSLSTLSLSHQMDEDRLVHACAEWLEGTLTA